MSKMFMLSKDFAPRMCLVGSIAFVLGIIVSSTICRVHARQSVLISKGYSTDNTYLDKKIAKKLLHLAGLAVLDTSVTEDNWNESLEESMAWQGLLEQVSLHHPGYSLKVINSDLYPPRYPMESRGLGHIILCSPHPRDPEGTMSAYGYFFDQSYFSEAYFFRAISSDWILENYK